jgi:uncharacterized membrane protein YbhN (UPF0104 family)
MRLQVPDSPARHAASAERGPHTTLTLTRGHIRRLLLRLLAYTLLALLVWKLVPGLEQAFESLGRVSWWWVLAALALETASEMGYVISWKAIVDPDDRLAEQGGSRLGMHLAWAQLGGGTLVPAGSFGGIGVGAWILHRLGMPSERIAEDLLSLSFLNTATDALALLLFGLAQGVGLLHGKNDLPLTIVPAAAAACGIVAVLLLARRGAAIAQQERAGHPRRAASLTAIANAVRQTDEFIFHGVRVRSVLGAIAYLGFDVAVLWSAFPAVHANPALGLGPVMMAYIIGALGGSVPFLPAGMGAILGMSGMLIVYGAHGNDAVAAVLAYQAVGLLVPLAGGTIAFLLLRRALSLAPRMLDGTA